MLTSVFQEIKPTEAFIVEKGNQYLSASGGGLYSADGKTLISYATGVPDIVIPDGVEAVGPYAFLDCLPDSIILPESVTALDPDTFSAMGECGPVGIVIPESVESIGYRASKADVYMFQPFFFYMREGEMRCTWSSAGDHVPMLIEAWEHPRLPDAGGNLRGAVGTRLLRPAHLLRRGHRPHPLHLLHHQRGNL